MSSEFVLHVLITESLQINGHESVQHEDPLIQGSDPGHVGWTGHSKGTN